MPFMPNEPQRLAHLRTYLLALGADMAASGKFQGAGADRLEAAALAALSGTGAMAAQLWADVKVLGGEGAALVQPAIEGVFARMADRLVREGVGHAASVVSDLFNKPAAPTRKTAGKAAAAPASASAAERQRLGKQFMDAVTPRR